MIEGLKGQSYWEFMAQLPLARHLPSAQVRCTAIIRHSRFASLPRWLSIYFWGSCEAFVIGNFVVGWIDCGWWC